MKWKPSTPLDYLYILYLVCEYVVCLYLMFICTPTHRSFIEQPKNQTPTIKLPSHSKYHLRHLKNTVHFRLCFYLFFFFFSFFWNNNLIIVFNRKWKTKKPENTKKYKVKNADIYENYIKKKIYLITINDITTATTTKV